MDVPDVPGAPEHLVNQIREDKCVLFVGAGLSQGAGLPGWPGFVGTGAFSEVGEREA